MPSVNGFKVFDERDVDQSLVFPPGSYCIADLGLLFNRKRYLAFIDHLSWSTSVYFKKGNDVIGICSTGNDGCYRDSLGRLYGVDGGNIAIVPAHLVCPDRGAPEPVLFKNDFQFIYVEEGDNQYILLKDSIDPSNSFKIFLKGDGADDDDDDDDDDVEEDDEVEVESESWQYDFGDGSKTYERLVYDTTTYIYDIHTKHYLGAYNPANNTLDSSVPDILVNAV